MSRLLHRLAACAAGAALAVAGPFATGAHADTPAAVNLATNPGFEIPQLPLDDWGSVPGWQCTAGEAAIGGTAHSGGSALLVTPAAADSTGRCEQLLAVRPATTYTVSAWVRGAYVFLGAEGTGHDAAPAWTPDTGGEWHRLTTSFTTGAAVTSVRLYLHGWYGQGAYAADDVRVDGPEPAPARALWNVPTDDPVFFVTVDDGWQRTPEAAALIADRKLPVTAFPLPMPLGFDPDWFRAVTAAPGSSVQDHSVSHRDLTTLSAEEQQAEICGGRDAALRRTGTAPTVFRPPYLAWNADTLQAAANCGATTVMTATADFSWGASNVYHGGPLRPGDVVLLHFTDTLAGDLARVLAAADAAGLRPAGLTEYLS
ncbi:polysaccharide deacetylase family protein [Streptomyces sp. NRRL B-24484]|uniref:polysaccharide deacetylase family protein n=1 Tax=Streptomyces sp. NRRL B-24484 TaxID=1463833 RepID=UPI000694675E|nr:polysaccharide deacetylase family protein [Streptomyces sp. NRRL B-24484]